MSNTDEATFQPVETPKNKGGRPKKIVHELKVINSGDGETYETKFECMQCLRSMTQTGSFYFKPYCPRCHVEMRRDRK